MNQDRLRDPPPGWVLFDVCLRFDARDEDPGLCACCGWTDEDHDHASFDAEEQAAPHSRRPPTVQAA